MTKKKELELDAQLKELVADIKKSDWFPTHASLKYPDGLWRWINSVMDDFRTRISYEPFEIWKRQAEEWLKDTDQMSDYDTYEEQVEFLQREFKRCRDNTLYFSNKYGYIKEGQDQVGAGWTKYEAWEAQKIVMFLFDCGYSLMLVKPRQVGFTSTIMLCAIKRINFNRNYFVKFMTSSTKKALEIIEDKLKPSFSMVPNWLAQPALNDNMFELNLAIRAEKGRASGFNSRIEVNVPTEDAINGGSPPLVLCDEIGIMGNFGGMLAEARPALLYTDPRTGIMSWARQIIAWGTGYNMDEGGAALEAEFNPCLDAWQRKDFSYGLIPIFFNVYARQGITDEIIDGEKRVAYSKQGPDREKYIVKFHQAYPKTVQEVFMRSSKTMLPINTINEHLLKIQHVDKDLQPRYGYFDPIYDITQKVENLYWPYKVIGAKFVETGAMDDDQTTACIFRDPEPNWRYRDFKGIDPINSQTGKSKFSATIWDAEYNTAACVVNFRTDNPNDVYAQSVLQSLYYFPKKDWKELIESNIGDGYYDFLERHGFSRNIVANGSLPVLLQTPNSKWWGISNKTNTANKIVTEIKEMIQVSVQNIYIPWFFIQLKTFVEKELKNPTDSNRMVRYQAADLRYNRDDVIFSMVFAYICSKAFSKHKPERIDAVVGEDEYKVKRVQNRQTNYSPKWAMVDRDGNVVRFLTAEQVQKRFGK